MLSFEIGVVLAVFFFEFCSASGIGRCPRHPVMENFNISRFTGHWYEVERSFYLMELTYSCTTLDLEENSKGQVEVTAKTKSRWTGSVIISEGTAVPSKRDPSIFLYKVYSKLPSNLARYLPGAGFYQILNTDYDNFAILWSCSNFGLAHTDLVWILGRNKEIDVNMRAKIYDMLARLRIDSERLIIPRSNNCTDISYL